MIRHYYHCWVGNRWEDIVKSHLDLLDDLSYEIELMVGIVGPPAQRKRLIRKLPKGTEIIAEADTGFEQVTLSQIQPDGIVVYSHTKGAANNHQVNKRWRETLEHYTFHPSVVQQALTGLYGEKVDVVAPHWLTKSITGQLPPGCAGFSPGNYWWTRGEYLAKLPELVNHQNRYAAEEWIGMGDPRVGVTDSQPWDWRRWS